MKQVVFEWVYGFHQEISMWILEDCKPQDYDFWLECRNCGRLYQKYKTKVEPEIEPIKQPMNEPKGKV